MEGCVGERGRGGQGRGKKEGERREKRGDTGRRGEREERGWEGEHYSWVIDSVGGGEVRVSVGEGVGRGV